MGDEGCECWRGRLGKMVRDQRAPNLYKRASMAVTCHYIRNHLPPIAGTQQTWRWSREHNDLFYSWMYHYGEEHIAGRQYNCTLYTARLLEFQHATGLDYPGIVMKVNNWAAAVNGWHMGQSYILLQEERMQFWTLQPSFDQIGLWLENNPDVQSASQVPLHVMVAWREAAKRANQHNVDLDIIVSDYIQRARIIREKDNFLRYMKREKENFVLRSLEEINYEIVWDTSYPREYVPPAVC